MNEPVIVTEGPTDAAILRAILASVPDLPEYETVAAGGWSAADSLARSYLLIGKNDVALVVDADSRDPNVVEDRKRFLRRSLASVPSRTRFEVVVMEPTIESLLLEDRNDLEVLAGKSVSDSLLSWKDLDPNRAISDLFPSGSLIAALEKHRGQVGFAKARQRAEIEMLVRFLRSRSSTAAAA